MQTNIDITQAFLKAPDGILSIHQLSQNLKLPYGTTYNRVHILEKQNILQILPQGKAKLCALNPSNPMTRCLLALGGSQQTENFRQKLSVSQKVFDTIIDSITKESKGNILSAILLSPITLSELDKKQNSITKDNPHIILEEYQNTLDFFFIKTTEDYNENILEEKITNSLPQELNISITTMAVVPEALIDMLNIDEEEAGQAAYSMLQEGILLTGFENFYNIILKVFSEKIRSI